jgi:uncharacterized protein (DUF58 family)
LRSPRTAILLLGLALAAVGAAKASGAVLGVGLGALLYGGVMAHLAGAARAVDLTRSVRPRRVFQGETAVVTVRLANQTAWPLYRLAVVDAVPEGLAPLDPPEAAGWVPPRRAVAFQYRLRAERRGGYRLGPAVLQASDPLGFETVTERLPRSLAVVCYPPWREARPPLSGRRPVGTETAPSLVDDPTHFLALRPWQPGDPLRRVDWRASARQADGGLVVRTFAGSVRRDLLIAVDLSGEETWRTPPKDVVDLLTAEAAALARLAARSGQRVGLVANAVLPTDDAHTLGVAIPFGRGVAHLTLVLAALGQMEPAGFVLAFPKLLAEALKVAGRGVTLVAVAHTWRPELAATLAQAVRQGAAVEARVVAGEVVPRPPAVRVEVLRP